jgi:hypothetical protein
MNLMRRHSVSYIYIIQLDFEGLTGRIKFDEDGYREDYRLNVFTVGLDTGPTKVCI